MSILVGIIIALFMLPVVGLGAVLAMMVYHLWQFIRYVHDEGRGWFILLPLILAVSAGWDIAPAHQPKRGLEADAAVVDGKPVAFKRIGEVLGVRVTRTSWRATAGDARVELREERKDNGRDFEITVHNGWTSRLDTLDIRLPEIRGPVGSRITSSFRGGATAEAPSSWVQGNGSTWPGAGFSPIVSIEGAGETLGITYLSRSLTPTLCFWFAGPNGEVNPFLRYQLSLQPGESITLSASYRIMPGGAADHQKYYRRHFLAPFMADVGIPEASLDLPPGPIVYSNWTAPEDMRASLERAKAGGAAAFIQWSPPSGRAYYYDPYPPHFSWFESLPVARDVGIRTGVLINPFVSPPLAADKIALVADAPYIETNLRLDLAATRDYHARLRDALVARGVSLAFWDTGGQPSPRKGHEWLRLMADWKRAGIAIMPETSCDVAAWATGIWMEYPYSWGTYEVAKTVTPKAILAGHRNTPDVRNGIDWRDDAGAKGLRPIIHLDTLRSHP